MIQKPPKNKYITLLFFLPPPTETIYREKTEEYERGGRRVGGVDAQTYA